MISESTIQQALRVRFSNHKYVLCNSFVFSWESDFFSLSGGGYCYEIEIKISRSDFFKDFEKDKHFLFSNSKQTFVIQKFPEPTNDPLWDVYSNHYANASDFIPGSRHDREYYEYCKLKWMNAETFVIPHRFYYAVPVGLIKLNELPSYAGLIEIENDRAFITKEAPFLHKRELWNTKFYQTVLDKFYWITENQRRSVEWNKYEVERLTTCVENLQKQIDVA